MKMSFLRTKKKFPPKDIFSLLSNSKYRQNHVPRLQNGRHILSCDCCVIWLGLTSPGGLGATIEEKMSEDVQQGQRAKRKKGGNIVSLAQLTASAVIMEVIPQMFLFINFQQTWLREMHGWSLFVSIDRISHHRDRPCCVLLTSKHVASPEWVGLHLKIHLLSKLEICKRGRFLQETPPLYPWTMKRVQDSEDK